MHRIDKEEFVFRPPVIQDAGAVYGLVDLCKPLDINSRYNYMLLCDHFRDTCILAETDTGTAGFISGYLHPSRHDTFFVWQVAVHPDLRRKGLGLSMLHHLVRRPAVHSVSYIETTVTPSNGASRNMFYTLADQLEAHCVEEVCYPAVLFGKSAHEDEVLFRIGPFRNSGIIRRTR